MTDIISGDELKAVYTHARQSTSGRIKISELLDAPFSYSKEKARGVLGHLISKRLAYQPKESQGQPDTCICARDQELAKRLGNMEIQMYSVFCMIELSSTSGITSRDVSRNLNDLLKRKNKPPIAPTTITRLLKTLETERFVKQVKSVKDPGRKLFILFDLEGDRSIVGGAFYKDGEFNGELVEEYKMKILGYLETSSVPVPQKKLFEFVYGLGDLSMRLSEYDLEKVVRTCILENSVIAHIHPHTGDTSYSYLRWPSFEDLERLPCTSCPVQSICQIEEVDRFDSIVLRRQNLKPRERSKIEESLSAGTGAAGAHHASQALTSKVTPSTCPYYNQWLRLPMMPWVPNPAASTAQLENGGGNDGDGS